MALLLIFNLILPAGTVDNTCAVKEIKVTGPDTVSINLSGIPKYKIFELTKPERLAIDLSNTEYSLKDKISVAAGPYILKVRAAQFKKRPALIARIVIELKTTDVEYEVNEISGNALEIKFYPPAAAESAAKGPQAALSPITPKPAVEKTAEVTEVKTPELAAAAPVVPKPQNENDPELVSAQIHRGLTLPNQPVSFDFESADIRDVFRVLSIKSGINIVSGEDVQGTISVSLNNVPFDKAFYTILSLKNLVAEETGPNIIRVETPQQIALEREKDVTFTKVFPLNYAKAAEIKVDLDNIRQAEGRKGGVSVDKRTNSLIVTDTIEGLQSVERIITELDKRPEQVIIEAKIVEIDLNKSLDLGVQWQYAGTAGDQNVTIGASQNHVVGDNDIVAGPNAKIGANTVTPTGVINNAPGGGLANTTGVSFPAAAVNGQLSTIAFGVLSNGNKLNIILSALQQKGMSKILSSPKVTTINGKEAKILIGQKIPYSTTTVSLGQVTQQTNFLDVGIKLTVTPTINNVNQKITLDVHPEVSLYVRQDPAGPVIGTREAETTVLVNNGETVVIGGLITDSDQKAYTQVPLLGDIPIIGAFFKHNLTSKDRTELLVFITPQIVK